MSSLIDAFNNFIKSLQPQEVGQLNLRSCLGCSFRKLLLKEDFCTQVQPPSKIFNPYDAQLCIYYTPETATTGQITKAERETQSSQLDLIKLINCINLIDRITLIDTITSIGTIGEITRIKDAPFYRENIIANYGFETNDLTGWYIVSGTPSIKSDGGLLSRTGFYVCSLKNTGGIYDAIGQALSRPVLSDDVVKFYVVAKTVAGNHSFYAYVYYADDTSSEHILAATVSDQCFTITPTVNKIIGGVRLVSSGDVGSEILVDEITIIARVRTERENLFLKDMDFAANAALQSFLAAVPSKKHKVYAYGYEADADGVYYFSATVNGSAFKFGRRITKGVMVQTLVHPIVCDVNTVLNFMSTTGNSKTWIQYKTEA